MAKLFLLLGIMTLLQSCGFKLRGSQALPDDITSVILVANFNYSPLQRALDRRLPVYQLQSRVVERKALNTITDLNSVAIILQPESLERRLLSVFSTGQVAEYELIFSVNYQVIFPNSEPIKASMTVAREYQDDPDEVLAKSRELDLVLDEMRNETADRMIRLLSSQYTSAVKLSANKTPYSQSPAVE